MDENSGISNQSNQHILLERQANTYKEQAMVYIEGTWNIKKIR